MHTIDAVPRAKLDWDGPDNGSLAEAYVVRPDGSQDEYLVQHRPDVGGEHQWYWCAGHKNNLDDNLCGFVRGYEECIRYCEMVAFMRMSMWRAA